MNELQDISPETLPKPKTKSVRILMLTSSYPKFPGDVTAPFIEAIAQFTQSGGNYVSVLTPHHPELKRQKNENGVHFYTYKYVPFRRWNIWGYASSLEGDVKIRKQIYLLLPLVLLSSFWQMWWLTGRERFEVIQAHWVIPNAPIAVFVGLLRRIPVVISLHGSDVFVAERIKPVGWVARWAFRRAAAVTASSPDLLERAQKLGAPTDPERAVVIPYGADPSVFKQPTEPREQLRQRLGFAPQTEAEPILLCVGRLVYKKGFEYAIQAMPQILQKFPAAKLVVAGKGDLLNELQTLAAKLGVSNNVKFVGAVPHHQVPDYLAACDLFLLPSVIDKSGNVDGLPNTLLEAMAAEKAVVASRVAGVPLAVTDGENGLLVTPGDSQQLANAVIELLGDVDLRAKYGQAARQTIEQRLNWRTIADHYIKVFKTAISE